jgi:hypothetical protein
MAETVSKLGEGLKAVDDKLLELGTTFKDVTSNTKKFSGGVSETLKALKSTAEQGGKAKAAMAGMGAAASGAAFGVLSLVDAGAKIGAVVKIAMSAEKALRDFNSVGRTIDLEKAIQGTDTLSKNLKILEASSGSAADTIVTVFNAALNGAKFQEMSAQAVGAYAPVEQAAYRLGTITASSGQRAIDTIQSNIAVTRKLQEATKDATNTVATLNAQYDIASAGFTSQSDNLQVGEASINLSQGGFGETAGATDAIVKVLRALGDEASDADTRAAQLFETTKVGLLTLDQLTGIIGPLAVQSKQLGVEFSEITGALAGLTTQGVSASEGATRLEALFGEITNASAETNAQLAAFRDEAGKPIQLNAAVLKDKGIQGVIKDLRTATGGNVAQLQKLFSTKEAVEAVQLLLSLGDEALASYTDRIESVDPKALGEEAAGRKKTVTGSFDAAKNKSQRQVEDFGKGLSVDIVQAVTASENALSQFATGSAEAIGGLAGTVAGLGTKLKAIGGFVVTAFSVLAPLAFASIAISAFEKVGKKILSLKDAFKAAQKPGESIWQTILRKAEDGIVQIIARWERALTRVKTKAIQAGKDIDVALNQKKQGPLPAPVQGPLPAGTPINKVVPFTRTSAGQIAGLTNAAEKAKAAFTGVGKAGLGLAKGGVGLAGQVLSKVGGYMVGLGAAAVAGGAAIAIISGNVSSFVQLLDKRTNPALQEAAANLKELENVEGLSSLLDDLDPLTSKLENTSFASAVFNETLQRGTKLWSDLTGSSRVYFQQTLPELEKLTAAIRDNNEANIEAANKGIIGTSTVEGQAAEKKISLGIGLNSEDEQALQEEVKQKQLALTKELQLEEAKLAAGKGKLNPEQLEEAQDNLKATKDRIESEKELLDVQLKRKLVEQQVQTFRNIDTTIPINIVVADNAEQGVKAQITEITDILNSSDFDINADPEKFADNFASIQSKLKGATDSIGLAVDIDVTSAQSLRNELIKSVGAEDFAKFIASNPQFKAQFAELNQKITDELVKQTDANTAARSAVLQSALSTGDLQGGQLTTIKVGIELEGVDTKVKALGEELARPETTLVRQREIIKQIEQLESERLSLNIEGAVAKELGARKQVLTIQEELLNAKKAEVALLSEESRYGSLAISSAQAKLVAAQAELDVKKETIALANAEKDIQNKTALAAVAKAADRQQQNTTTVLGLGDEAVSTADKNNKKFAADKKAELGKQSQVIEANRQNKQAQAASTQGVFDKDQQDLIARGLLVDGKGGALSRRVAKAELFDEDGRLKDQEKTLTKLADRSNSRVGGPNFDEAAAAGKAQQAILDKRLADVQQTRSIDGEAKGAIKQIEDKTKQEIDTRQRLTDKIKQQVQTAESDNPLKDLKVVGEVDVSKAPVDVAATSNEAPAASAQAATSKTLGELKAELSTVTERFKVMEAQLNLDFAAREKTITQNNLVADSLSKLAGNSALFGDSLVGAQLDLLALNTKDLQGQVNTEADKEIARIDATVKAFADQLDKSKEILAAAIANGADPETIKQLEGQVKQAETQSQAVTKEGEADKAFVEQQRALELLTAKTEEAVAAIEVEIKQRERFIEIAAKVDEAMDQLQSTTLLQNTAFAANLEAQTATEKAGRKEGTVKAEGEVQKIEARLVALRELASQDSEAGKKAKELLPAAETEAKQEIEAANLKGALEDFSNQLNATNAVIEAEAATRQRSIDTIKKTADALAKLEGNTLLQNSAAAASLKSFRTSQVASTKEGKSNADTEIAKVDARIEGLRELAKQDNKAGEFAKKQLPQEEKAATDEKAALALDGVITDLDNSLQASAAAVEEEYSSRTRIISQNDNVISSLNTLANTAGTLFSSSSLGATLSRVATDLSNKSGKLQNEYNKEIAIIEARNASLGTAVVEAEANGADPEVLAQLKRAKALDDAQKDTETGYLRQKLALDTLNQSMSSMSARVSEVTDVLSKQVDLYKDQIDFQQRQNESNGLENSSAGDLQSSLINFLGKNNGATDIVNQRLDFQKAEQQAQLEKSKNVAEAKKQSLDIALLQSQLDLEQQSYENALTQTLLLQDLISVNQGGEASNVGTQQVQDQLNQLPRLIEQSRAQALQRQDLVAQQAAFIPEELAVKNRAVDRNTAASQLSILGNDLNPANIDLIKDVLGRTQDQLNNFDKREVTVGSLDDKGFQRQLAEIRSTRDTFGSQSRPTPGSENTKSAGQTLSVNAPIQVSVDLSNSSNVDEAKIKQLIKNEVMPSFNKSVDNLSQRVLNYANTF